MKLSEIKQVLQTIDEVEFFLPSGKKVPPHFHATEVGSIKKHFIDCGGKIRNESLINFQLFTATDYYHQSSAQKLKTIIKLSELKLGLSNADIEVEYQDNTIGKYGSSFHKGSFLSTNTLTDCLAKDKCGISQNKPKIKLSELQSNGCTPTSGCY